MEQAVSTKTKTNKVFMVLSALGILFVVDCHSASGIGLFTSVFPYDSFFMPMFMFISGYFWKETSIASWTGIYTNLKKKFVKLMVPYLLWAVFYSFLIWILNGLGMNWPWLSARDFVYSILTDGTTNSLNGAAWFVPTLFAVTVAYTVLRKLLRHGWNDTAALIGFILLGTATVALTKGPDGVYHKALLLYKTGFFIQFFHLGYYFGKRLEKWFDSLNSLGVCLAMMAVNMLLLACYENITFGRCAFMADFAGSNLLLPLITSVTGIFFWLKIAKFLEPILGGSRLVNYISENTFFIMMHHLIFVKLFSALLYAGMRLGISILSDFDVAAFRTDPWYLYTPYEWVKAAYFLFGITGTLLACKLFDRITAWVKQYVRRSRAK